MPLLIVIGNIVRQKNAPIMHLLWSVIPVQTDILLAMGLPYWGTKGTSLVPAEISALAASIAAIAASPT